MEKGERLTWSMTAQVSRRNTPATMAGFFMDIERSGSNGFEALQVLQT
jgi:hypothetical protein